MFQIFDAETVQLSSIISQVAHVCCGLMVES